MKKILEECVVNGDMPCDGKGSDFLSHVGLKELANRVKAMTPEELEVVSDNIPVELCLKRIQKELNKAKELENGIANIVSKLGG